MSSEAWLEGPLEGYPALLMPVAHSLVQSRRDLRAAVEGLTDSELWQRPGGAASVGYHLLHVAGSTDRLYTYAQGNMLSGEQVAALAAERNPGESVGSARDLLDRVERSLDRVLEGLKHAGADQLTAARYVGRARLPTTLIGLLFHIAEHAQRHAGQAVTTAKIVRGGDVQARPVDSVR